MLGVNDGSRDGAALGPFDGEALGTIDGIPLGVRLGE